MTLSNINDREYPRQPMVGVGAIVFRNKEVLLVKRNKEPSKGFWSIPGGLVELGEDLREALKREVKEECGLEIKPRILLDVITAIHKDEDGKVKFHYVIVDYLAEWQGGKPFPGSDVEEIMWIPLADLDKYKVTESALTVIKKVIQRK